MNNKPEIKKQPSDRFWYPHLLKALNNLGGSAGINEAKQETMRYFYIDDAVLGEVTKKNEFPTLSNNIGWARNFLVLAEYIDDVSDRGVWTLSKKAKKEMPNILGIIEKDEKEGIAGFPVKKGNEPNVSSFIDKVLKLARDKRAQKGQSSAGIADKSADSQIENVADKEEAQEHQKLQKDLDVIKKTDPYQFERLCALIFKKVGYENVKNTPKSKDGGFDGSGYCVLGLLRFKVVFESKRYTNVQKSGRKIKVSGPEISKLVGSMMGATRAEKGVFITTSDFSTDALKRAAELGSMITLINGEMLIKLLREHKIGYDKNGKIDPKFFKGV